MMTGTFRTRLLRLFLATAISLYSAGAWSAGTPAGTVIDNIASVNFDLGGTNITQNSNLVSVTVVERIDVVVTLQSGQILVAANDTARSILFTVTNTGNGTELFQLSMNSVLGGDDFDPVPAVPDIYFDSDASGDFTIADVAYVQGNNDPVLLPDESMDILIVNDIPGTVVNSNLGRSDLTATSGTGSGAPGDTFVGLGDGGVDAVIGASGGEATVFGEYLVSDVQLSIVKSVAIADPFGGNEPTPGATLTYTIAIEVVNSGTATGATFSDPVPALTTFVANSISLNGGNLTDGIDTDAGELDTSSAPTVIVRLGDLTQADGVQTVIFAVTID